MRLFFSINPPDGFKDKIQKIQNQLKGQFSGTFADPRKFHVTILFLGEVEANKVGEIKNVAARTAGKSSPFSLVVRGVDFLGDSLVITFESSKGFSKIFHSLKEALAGLAPVNLAPAPVPHLTLLRFRKEENKKALQGLSIAYGEGLLLPVSSFHLVESVPISNGHIYTNLSAFRLNKIYITT